MGRRGESPRRPLFRRPQNTHLRELALAADKEEIRDRTDVVELIGTYVPLKQRGRNWLGLCPFHQEKTPSFNVTPLTRSFKCFGCGASGDCFTFVERYNN